MRKQQPDSSNNSDQQKKPPGKPVLNQETKCNTHENAARTLKTKLSKIPNSNHFSLDSRKLFQKLKTLEIKSKLNGTVANFLAVSVFFFESFPLPLGLSLLLSWYLSQKAFLPNLLSPPLSLCVSILVCLFKD